MSLLTHEPQRYDPTVAVLTATLVSIIWYTQFQFEGLFHTKTRDANERLRARTTLATGVLEEMRWLEGRLAQVYEHGPNLLYDPLSHPILELALEQSALFDPEAVAALASFYSRLRDARTAFNECRSLQAKLAPGDETHLKNIAQVKAALTMNSMSRVVRALLSQGAAFPAAKQDTAVSLTGAPDLTPSPFGAASLRSDRSLGGSARDRLGA